MTITVEELESLLLPEDEIPDRDLGYSTIEPYKTKPIQGGTGFLFMKRIKERHLLGQEWMPTNVLHDIYFSAMGSHTNLLIKLAKSKYLETKIETTTIDVETAEGVFPQDKYTRLWRLTKKGLNYLTKYDMPFDELVEKARNRATNYLRKKSIEFEVSYPYGGHGIIAFDELDYCGGSKRVEFRFEDLARKPSGFARFRNIARWHRDDRDNDEEQEQKFTEAEEWLQEHPDIKTSVVTPVGVISVEGDVRRNNMALNGNRICVVPGLPVHISDIYICRLSWLNYDLDRLIRLIVREHILVECPSCNSAAKYGNVFQSGWVYCPICAAPIDTMVESYIFHRRWKE